MNILFLSTANYYSIESKTMYMDLLRQFRNDGADIYVLSANPNSDELIRIEEENCIIYKVPIGSLQKASIIKKGLNTISVEKKYIKIIKQCLKDVRFELILYPTPPITLCGVVEYVKKRDGAYTYLLLKDIFPQNAVDLGLMKKKGLLKIIYSFFRYKEKKLYRVSDGIGCMSKANVDYVLKHNPEIKRTNVEVCPNSIEVVDNSISSSDRLLIRKKYCIPQNRTVFVYGGNLGKPQGISFLIECLKTLQSREDIFFVIVGNGTEYHLLEEYTKSKDVKNVKLLKRLPKEDYDTLVAACDVGMIFLDHSFTIPNYPSRLLSYMQAQIPIIAVTDPITDLKEALYEGNCGWWCESDNTTDFTNNVDVIIKSNLKEMGSNAYRYLQENFDVEKSYKIISNRIKM